MDEEKIIFRRAGHEDAARAVEIVFTTLRSYGIEPEPAGLDSAFVTFGDNACRNVQDFVAELDGRVHGVMAISTEEPKQPKITGLYVSPDARRKGLGRGLLQHAIDEARARGATRINLETRTIFKEAIALYESTGWMRGADLPEGYGPDRTYSIDLIGG